MSRTAPRHLLEMEDLSADDVLTLIRRARQHKQNQPVPLGGQTVVTAFFENSTRTLLSFQMAIARLGHRHMDFAADRSSIAKGESVRNSFRTLQRLGAAAVVVRHGQQGFARDVAQHLDIPVINAGDGANAHPTQALTDLFTLMEHFDALEGLRVAIIGDVKHSRVARSFIAGLNMLGADLRAFAPPPMRTTEKMDWRDSIEDAIEDAQVAFVLRPQFERHKDTKMSPQEYAQHFMFRVPHLDIVKRNNGFVMHAGPVNEDVDIAAEAVRDNCSLIEEQVRNSVFARMAVLEHTIGGAQQ